jgi:hypothetical protein
MDNYDPEMHKPIYLDELPALRQALCEQIIDNQHWAGIHSKHVWFGEWQNKMFSDVARTANS